MTPQQMQLSEYIQDKLWDCRLKQNQVAKKVGVSPAYISRLIHGTQNTSPSVEFCKALARCFNVDTEEVLDAAGVYDKSALDTAIEKNPDLAAIVRELYADVR